MNITLENKIKILEYKLAYELEKKIAKEFEDGNADLNYRLSFFREKIDKSTYFSDTPQQKVYDKIFNTGNVDDTNIVKIEDDGAIQKSSKKISNIDKWVKKTYIRIAKSVHPDITMHIKSEELRAKFDDYYLIAQHAYENNIPADLIMIAFELDIEVPEKEIKINIVDSLNKKQVTINDTKNKIGWQWYHIPDENKDAELKKILTGLGFVFTEEKIKEAINSRKPKRKVGQRPQKINVKRKRLK